MSPDIEIQQQVARCLALFALQHILGFVKSTDALSQRFGTLAIGNLNDKDLFDQGAIAALLHLETSSDAETRWCLAFAINNVAGNEINWAQLGKMGILRTIIGIMERRGRRPYNLSLAESNKVSIANSVLLPLLIQLVGSPDTDMNATSIDIHREASRAMANLFTSFGHHGDMIAEGLPGLIHLALSVDTECQYNAALATWGPTRLNQVDTRSVLKRRQLRASAVCRHCIDSGRPETLAHVLQHCPHNHGLITRRHDASLDKIAAAIRKALPAATVKVNELVDGYSPRALRPDLQVYFDVGARRVAVLLDLAITLEHAVDGTATDCPFERIVRKKEDKYFELGPHLRQTYDENETALSHLLGLHKPVIQGLERRLSIDHIQASAAI
ncbi:hypothetical protein SPRG_11985 [Saprolegnia parasitica CBS 223.65]|uniref:Uncharacterized protein n=1 Tax=Saprolegnia parasitica (strain CBS 223.65) TaxID=695850 RepID=A0A067BX54_SAPPC|nr:hypothetical protein SPRG_11985 [Saprolegnia parasitica CBS 223.65]KDO22848.1 hypothetical protein SPRG_11985 [Saprolegnia parasitica CBS 223.65]|eukprot:XP_012206405.1 hypothetical protein SPRG_11985 [Saprolegnia parasitica CBS 223.65]